jgi:hypothetical protein
LALVFAFAIVWLALGRILWKRWLWGPALLGAALIMLSTLLLPAGHPRRTETAAWAQVLFWLALAAAPIWAYALWVRKLRRRTGADEAPAVPQGLVQFPRDAALAAETAAALLAEAPGARLTLGWRDEAAPRGRAGAGDPRRRSHRRAGRPLAGSVGVPPRRLSPRSRGRRPALAGEGAVSGGVATRGSVL